MNDSVVGTEDCGDATARRGDGGVKTFQCRSQSRHAVNALLYYTACYDLGT